ncbi:MAG: AAA family ATPase, partial [Planctomycetota bacterium]
MSPETRVTSDPGVEAEASRLVADVGSIRAEVKRLLVGQERALEELLAVLLAGGHALVEGVPGTGKTLLVRSLARVAGLDFRRVQFTPDLLPADI